MRAAGQAAGALLIERKRGRECNELSAAAAASAAPAVLCLASNLHSVSLSTWEKCRSGTDSGAAAAAAALPHGVLRDLSAWETVTVKVTVGRRQGTAAGALVHKGEVRSANYSFRQLISN